MTEIRLHNSLTRRKKPEVFRPLDPKNVRMYVCGPTVYDRAHIGNARPVVVFDVLYRLLRHVYGADHVTYVRNITDIDDKIMERAKATGRPIGDITAETTGWFHDDMAALGALPPTHEPRATDWVAQMVAMIERLIARGYAYEAEGHVLFDVGRNPDYGRLSGRSTDDMIAGARVEVAPYKRGAMDFVLWKPSTPDQPGWDSPWGRGRPGWHIECSAMSRELLGADFDIHAGGADLMFPHHENELAQSTCADPGCGFAGTWLHNGMIKVDGRKMAKSLGNFLTVADLRDQAPGEVLRLAILMTHYRGELDWTEKTVADAEKALRRWRELAGLAATEGDPHPGVLHALADDLNTPQAVAELHQLALAGDANTLRSSAALLGLLESGMGEWATTPDIDEARRGLIRFALEKRLAARTAKDFARADSIRDALVAAGVEVMDRPGASSEWRLTSRFDPAKLDELPP